MKRKIVCLIIGISLAGLLLCGCKEAEPDTFQTISVTTGQLTGDDDSSPVVKEGSSAFEEEESESENKKQEKSSKKETKEEKDNQNEPVKEAEKENPKEEKKPDAGEKDEEAPSLQEKASVVRVVDGDTYVVNYKDSEIKVRLIGVDTPESVASDEYLEKTGKENTDFGKEVSAYMKTKLSAGDTIFLEFDVDKEDDYGRTLVYAYFSDGEMIQKHLLKNGLAKVMTIQPNVAHSDEFAAIEAEAMKNGVGMWEGYEESFE